jgi:hypothetical protein
MERSWSNRGGLTIKVAGCLGALVIDPTTTASVAGSLVAFNQ